MVDTLLSIFGLGYNYVSGVRHTNSLNALSEEIGKINVKVEKLSENIFYCPTLSEVSHSNQQVISNLRDIRLNLEPLQQVTGNRILSSSIITTTEEIKYQFKRDPFDVLDYVRPYNRAKAHPNPSMTPIIFSDQNVKYIGWIMKGLIPQVFGIDYDEKILYNHPKIITNIHNIPSPSKSVQTQSEYKVSEEEEQLLIHIYNKVKIILSNKLGINHSEIVLKSHLVDDFGADGLDLVELIMEFEKEFDIIINDEVSQNFIRVEDYVVKICDILISKR